MKRIVILALTVAMALTFAACGADTATESAPPAGSPSPTASSKVDTTAVTSPEVSGETSDVPVGYFKDEVDHFGRDPYNITYFYTATSPISAAIENALEDFQTILNFKYTSFTGEGDNDTYIEALTVKALTDTDGYLIDCDPRISSRALEVVNELGMPFVCILNPMYNEAGKCLAPAVALDNRAAAATCIDWMYENYKAQIGDVDTSKIGLVTVGFSIAIDFYERTEGAKERFLEYFPENRTFDADLITGTLSVETAYNEVAAIVTTTPEIEYWWFVGASNDCSQGAARAVETIGIDKNCMVSGIDSDQLVSEWDSGYEGCWSSALCMSSYNYVSLCMSGLIAIMDGRVGQEELWAERRAEGDIGTKQLVETGLLTKDTYKTYLNALYEGYGLKKPY